MDTISKTEEKLEEKTLHELFDIGIGLKGLHAITEIIGGVFATLVSSEYLLKTVAHFTQGELAEDPNDFFTQYLLVLAHDISIDTKQFIAFYLLSHGVVNLVLVVGLFRKKMWAYHASFVVLGLFILYQLYRYFSNPSLWLVLLSLFDFVILWLVWKEYERLVKLAKTK